MQASFDKAFVTVHGNAAVLTLNHPEVLNAACPQMVFGMIEALKFVARKENGIRALVLTGAGRAFCAGANLAETPAQASANDKNELEIVYHPLMRRLRDLNMPVIAAVNGPCVGIGMSIALMADIVIAARSAFFLQAFVRVGLSADGGSSWILPRLIGLARARELTLLGERLSAETAQQWGLISRVVDDGDLESEALALAERLANGPTLALQSIRTLYQTSFDNSYEEQIDLECRLQSIAEDSADFVEGVAAFNEKRAALFVGQ